MSRYPEEIKSAARSLYIKGFTPKEIAQELSIPQRTVYNWSNKYQWAKLIAYESMEEAINRRYNLLAQKNGKTELELVEMRDLVAQHVKLVGQRNKHAEKMAEIKARSDVTMSDFSGDGDDRESGSGRKGRRKKNDISHLTPEIFEEWAQGHLFEYQLYVREHKQEDWRFILKARQIGMTFYFAFEAFEDACLTGDNQVFFSASRAQAEIFQQYIIEIAEQHFGVRLSSTRNKIKLGNGAILRFLSTNASTAQGFNGHLYGDEIFWIPKFAKLHEVASAMTTQKRFRTTYFSTPSAKTHQAYPVWTGDHWKEDDNKRKVIPFPTDKALQKAGQRCPDTLWRYVITMEMAVAGGLDKLVDIDRLKNRYSESAYNMLYMCIFVDSKDAVFKFSDLEKCAVDASRWADFNPKSARPFGNREVWAGYDPARTGDNSTFVIVAPPLNEGERFRVLMIWHWRGLNFSYQAKQIQELKRIFNITYIGIDITGIGRNVYDMVSKFAPRETRPIHYSVESKNQLVSKMIDTIEHKRIEWSKDAIDEITRDRAEIAPSFMAIRRTTTASGGQMTFVAERSEATGHADIFFAISHAMINEPIDHEFEGSSTWAFGKAA
ncbi:terminase large subunit domain-containing protein [Klebsiella oxytoca]|uniref:terminase large subunit domain-containing protein n=1 Tax=Klebsiella oxytoca TaxID=571 RepID=UPI0018C7ACC4|nr:terminase family protein [Klebsiella oxytoca]MBG2650439.1 helix-turn-helix domain-containing protein [Klebsiella oxytoca]